MALHSAAVAAAAAAEDGAVAAAMRSASLFTPPQRSSLIRFSHLSPDAKALYSRIFRLRRRPLPEAFLAARRASRSNVDDDSDSISESIVVDNGIEYFGKNVPATHINNVPATHNETQDSNNSQPSSRNIVSFTSTNEQTIPLKTVDDLLAARVLVQAADVTSIDIILNSLNNTVLAALLRALSPRCATPPARKAELIAAVSRATLTKQTLISSFFKPLNQTTTTDTLPTAQQSIVPTSPPKNSRSSTMNRLIKAAEALPSCGRIVLLDPAFEYSMRKAYIIYHRLTMLPENDNFEIHFVLRGSFIRYAYDLDIGTPKKLPLWRSAEEVDTYITYLNILADLYNHHASRDYGYCAKFWLKIRDRFINTDINQHHHTNIPWFRSFMPESVLCRITFIILDSFTRLSWSNKEEEYRLENMRIILCRLLQSPLLSRTKRGKCYIYLLKLYISLGEESLSTDLIVEALSDDRILPDSKFTILRIAHTVLSKHYREMVASSPPKRKGRRVQRQSSKSDVKKDNLDSVGVSGEQLTDVVDSIVEQEIIVPVEVKNPKKGYPSEMKFYEHFTRLFGPDSLVQTLIREYILSADVTFKSTRIEIVGNKLSGNSVGQKAMWISTKVTQDQVLSITKAAIESQNSSDEIVIVQDSSVESTSESVESLPNCPDDTTEDLDDPDQTSNTNHRKVGVEEYVLDVLQKDGWIGIHAETSLVRTLFGLLMVDLMFHFVPKSCETTFIGPAQGRPLDLDYPDFYANRKDAIDRRLAEIARGFYRFHIIKSYEFQSYRAICDDINWNFSLDVLLQIADAIGGIRLARICKLFILNHRLFRSGFPDLCVWNLRTQPHPQNVLPLDLNVMREEFLRDGLLAKDIEPPHVFKSFGLPDPGEFLSDTLIASELGSILPCRYGYGGTFIIDDAEQLTAEPVFSEFEWDIMFLEVKGDKDRLSDIQTIWLWYLKHVVGIYAAEIHVKDKTSTDQTKRVIDNETKDNKRSKRRQM